MTKIQYEVLKNIIKVNGNCRAEFCIDCLLTDSYIHSNGKGHCYKEILEINAIAPDHKMNAKRLLIKELING